MVHLARSRTGSAVVAEDIVQEAFVRMHRRWCSVVNHGGYLRVMVVNGCRSWRRRQVREHALIRRVATREELHSSPCELQDALNALPNRQRAALVLRYYERLSPTEIAITLNVPRNTVKSDLRRGLTTLRHSIPV